MRTTGARPWQVLFDYPVPTVEQTLDLPLEITARLESILLSANDLWIDLGPTRQRIATAIALDMISNLIASLVGDLVVQIHLDSTSYRMSSLSSVVGMIGFESRLLVPSSERFEQADQAIARRYMNAGLGAVVNIFAEPISNEELAAILKNFVSDVQKWVEVMEMHPSRHDRAAEKEELMAQIAYASSMFVSHESEPALMAVSAVAESIQPEPESLFAAVCYALLALSDISSSIAFVSCSPIEPSEIQCAWTPEIPSTDYSLAQAEKVKYWAEIWWQEVKNAMSFSNAFESSLR